MNRSPILYLPHHPASWGYGCKHSAIASHFEVTRPAISQHLRVLEDCQLVEVRRQGTQRIYRIRSDTMAELRQYMEQFWQDSLVRLAEVAETEEKQNDG